MGIYQWVTYLSMLTIVRKLLILGSLTAYSRLSAVHHAIWYVRAPDVVAGNDAKQTTSSDSWAVGVISVALLKSECSFLNAEDVPDSEVRIRPYSDPVLVRVREVASMMPPYREPVPVRCR